jgi:hypothetical protein
VRVTGDGSREALVDRVALCERIVNETSLAVVAVGQHGQEGDLADALIARRAHLAETIREGASP